MIDSADTGCGSSSLSCDNDNDGYSSMEGECGGNDCNDNDATLNLICPNGGGGGGGGGGTTTPSTQLDKIIKDIQEKLNIIDKIKSDYNLKFGSIDWHIPMWIVALISFLILFIIISFFISIWLKLMISGLIGLIISLIVTYLIVKFIY